MPNTTWSPSEQIALSFDGAASPRVGLLGEIQFQPALLPSTWGLAWYRDNQRAVSVVTDADLPQGTALAAYLAAGEPARSSTFVGHARGPGSREAGDAAQPFVRSYAGRQWIFCCAGTLDAAIKTDLDLGDQFDVVPVGPSPEEHAFCFLLARLREHGARTIDAFGWRALQDLLSRVTAFGDVSLVLSDGIDLVAQRDPNDRIPFHWTRITPPHERPRLEGGSFSVQFDGPMDGSRTLLAFSTMPMRGGIWLPMEPGEVRIARRGACVWSSHPSGIDEHVFSFLGDPRAPELLGVEQTHTTGAQQQHSAIGGTSHETFDETAGQVELSSPQPPTETDPGVSRTIPNPGPEPEPVVLTVRHTTAYRYQFPVERSSHRFCLRPVEDDSQQLLEHRLDISVDGIARDFEDVFGNRARALEVQHPYDEMVITSKSKVRVHGVTASQLKWPYHRNQIPLVWMPWQRAMMQAYLMPTELPEPELRELSEFGMSFVERNDHDLVETLLDLNRTIYRDFTYVTGSTTIETTPFEVYVARRGVCQDFANVLICIARLLGVPARYRVGYIYTGGSYENKIQSDASHAWAEVYLPWTGWFGFDPTNGCLAGSDHIRIACGRQFRDAAPTAGTIYRGGGTETLDVEVQVERVE